MSKATLYSASVCFLAGGLSTLHAAGAAVLAAIPVGFGTAGPGLLGLWPSALTGNGSQAFHSTGHSSSGICGPRDTNALIELPQAM